MNGLGVPRDYASAISWFEKAAAQEDCDAQFNLGYMYDRGWGVPQSDADAFKWYEAAAKNGSGRGQFDLAACYQHGKYVAVDQEQAIHWYRQADASGVARAATCLEELLGMSLSLLMCLMLWSTISLPAYCQETPVTVVGTSIGIPDNCPTVLWPRGMSIEALSPNNLYPNGGNFGLGNTSGGFGMSGSGTMSGIGLAERTVNNLVQEQFQQPNYYVNRISQMEVVESKRSGSQFGLALSSQSQVLPRPKPFLLKPAVPGLTPFSLPAVDAILKDSSPSVDSVLKSGI